MKTLSAFLSSGLLVLVAVGVGACTSETASGDGDFAVEHLERASAASAAQLLTIEREPLAGDVAHYRLTLRVGDTPNALLGLHRVVRERAPWWPRRGDGAIMLLHGDFSTFDSNFALAAAPAGGLAVYLAERGVDVWGIDRRWTFAPAADADLSDFAAMDFGQALDDTRRGLAFARSLRALTGFGGGRMLLGGFSRGAQLTYAYAADEAQRPRGQRHVDGIAPIDAYAVLAPADDELRQGACARRDEQRALLDAGEVDNDNSVLPLLAELAEVAPDEPSPVFEGFTNRDVILFFGAQTFAFFAPTPVYHLAGGELGELGPVALRYTDEHVFGAWFAAAAPHQSLVETTDGDAMWCGEGALPPGSRVADITVPTLHVGAAGGFGDYARYTTELLGSSDVTVQILRLLDPADEIEDVGHADLLYGGLAVTEVWPPLAAWVAAH